MSKLLKILILIGVLLLICSLSHTDDYELLTLEEAINYIQNQDINLLAQDIINLDFLENNAPQIPHPKYTAVLLENGDLLIFPIQSEVNANFGHLHYIITYPEYLIEDFGARPSPRGNIIIGIGAGVIAITTITILIIQNR